MKEHLKHAICLALHLSAGLLAALADNTSTKPNILLVLVDDMGFSDIGCYGGEIPTPNIDALAAGGLRFTQFYNTARCSPTRASLMTGLYPHQAGMGFLDGLKKPESRGTHARLHDRCVTMAEVLGPAGYHTSIVGKWHLGQQNGTPPWERGFQRTASTQSGELYFPRQKGPEAANYVYLDGRKLPASSPEVGSGEWYSTFMFTDWALKFVDDAKSQGKPFFLYFAHGAPHFPLRAPADVIAKYRGKYKVGWDKLRKARHQRQIATGIVDAKWPLSPRPPDVPAWDSLSAAEQDRFDNIMAIYAAMIDCIDRSVGRMVAGLKERGMLDNTLILFLSDNGGNAEGGPQGITQGEPLGGPDSRVFLGMCWATLNNTPFRRYKHFTHEGGIATPLIAHWPAGIPAARNGKLDHQPGHLVDIMATAVDVTGAVYPAEFKGHRILPMEGISLLPAFKGQPLHRVKPIFWEHEGNRAIRSGAWKLVMKFKGDWELYHIPNDRTEQHNLVREQPDIVRMLTRQWNDWAASSFVDDWIGEVRTDWGEEIGARKKPQGRLTPTADATGHWTKERANAWQEQTGWLVGCNYLPASAINQLEMWQADTFDPAQIDKELGWAESLGFNSLRVFLHHLLWEQDPKGFLKRMDQFLAIADKHKIGVMFVLFDSCWDPHPELGKQRAPRKGVHNSGWVQSPGVADLQDTARHKLLEVYVKGVVGHFKNDRRVHAWDVWNEPDNTNNSSYGAQEPRNKQALVAALLPKVFAWARSAQPRQPLTSAPWLGPKADPSKLHAIERVQLEQSDVFSFHNYDGLAAVQKWIEYLRPQGRPILCSEYMKRRESQFDPILAYFKEQKVAAYNWGLVAGKSNTLFAWQTWQKPETADEPQLWFHDILRRDGTPFDPAETAYIRQIMGR